MVTVKALSGSQRESSYIFLLPPQKEGSWNSDLGAKDEVKRLLLLARARNKAVIIMAAIRGGGHWGLGLPAIVRGVMTDIMGLLPWLKAHPSADFLVRQKCCPG